MKKTLLAMLLAASGFAGDLKPPIQIASQYGFNFDKAFTKFERDVEDAQNRMNMSEIVDRKDLGRGFRIYQSIEFNSSGLEYDATITCNSCPGTLHLRTDYIPRSFSTGLGRHGIRTEFVIKIDYIRFNLGGDRYRMYFHEGSGMMKYDGPKEHLIRMSEWFDKIILPSLHNSAIRYRDSR